MVPREPTHDRHQDNWSNGSGPSPPWTAFRSPSQRGEVLGFLGPNGAGKSTTMKMVTGFLRAHRGHARWSAATTSTKEPMAVKEKIGYLPEGAPAYPDMTPESFLDFVAEVRGLKGAARRDAHRRGRRARSTSRA